MESTSAFLRQLRRSEALYTDIDQQALALAGYGQSYRQLSPGQFRGRFSSVFLDDSCDLHIEELSQRVLQAGCVPASAHAFGFQLEQSDRCTIEGEALELGQVLELPAGVEFDSCLGAGTKFCLVQFQGEGGKPTGMKSDRARVVRPPVNDVLFLKSTVASVLRCSLHPTGLVDIVELRERLRDVLWRIAGRDANEDKNCLSATRSYKVFCQAREFMEAHLAEDFAMLRVCAAAGVSRRTLEACFIRVVAESPLRYLRAMRLNAVRSELRASDWCGSIALTASRWGFWHPSKFSASYKALFGELPSETAAARAGAPS